MSTYVDPWWVQQVKATATISDEPKSSKVTYRGDDGKAFRVMVHQKPNPIGFRAELPGDKPRR